MRRNKLYAEESSPFYLEHPLHPIPPHHTLPTMALPLTAYPTSDSSKQLRFLLYAKRHLYQPTSLSACRVDNYLSLFGDLTYSPWNSSCHTISTLLLTEPTLIPTQEENISTTDTGIRISYHDVFQELYFCTPMDVQLIARNQEVMKALELMDWYADFLMMNWPYSTMWDCGGKAGVAVKRLAERAVGVARRGEGSHGWREMWEEVKREAGEAEWNM